MINRGVFLSLLLGLSVFSFSSCDVPDIGHYQNQSMNQLSEEKTKYEETVSQTETASEPASQTSEPVLTETVSVTTALQEVTEITTIPETHPVTEITEKTAQKAEVIFPPDPYPDLSSVPGYSGTPFTEINGGNPYFSVFTDDYFENYPEHDSLGRCGPVFEMLGPETMPDKEREEIGMVRPSGWHTVKYPDIIPDLYLYNRCHLIGFQLCGKNADERNLITGTRYMNVSGMLPFEDRTASYIRKSGNHVLYRVTPVFDGDDLVAKGVLMEALSVEDGGSGLSFCVFCYNVQPGIGINYSDGESWILEVPAEPEPEVPEREIPAAEEKAGQQYILNTNTKKFHYPSCSSVNQMKEKNKYEFTGTRDEVISQGYVPCKNCNP